MAVIARSNVSLDTSTGQFAPQFVGMAGEALTAGDFCYIGQYGLVWQASLIETTGSGYTHGFTARAVPSGQPVTLFGEGARMRYSTGLTPGNPLYLSATPGALSTTIDGGANRSVADVLTETDIRMTRFWNE